MKRDSFYKKCYSILKQVPKGKVATYKEIAKALKSKAYRAVGNAMKTNPYSPLVPCHRVICSDGKVGGYMGSLNNRKKIELLRKEGVEIINGKIDTDNFGFKF